jgi:nucleoside-diphosphate-sugar epimerase
MAELRRFHARAGMESAALDVLCRRLANESRNMPEKIFIAGAAGAIGKSLSRLLISHGFAVTGTTRSASRAEELRAIGVTPILIDVFDAAMLSAQMREAAPDVVMHQLTDLSGGFDPAHLENTLARNARIRREGTAGLVHAALAAGARRMVAQSISWMYRPGTPPYRESDPLDLVATGTKGMSLTGVVSLETQVLNTPGLEGVVLRYGHLYGPGTGNEKATQPGSLHVDAAAYAAMLAGDRGRPGIYNITEPGGEADSAKAIAELEWSPDFRLP